MPAHIQKQIIDVLKTSWANPISLHPHGQQAKMALEQAKVKIANFLDCSPSQLIFTSTATEANATAIKGYEKSISQLFIAPIEHPSVLENSRFLKTSTYTHIVPVLANGQIDLHALNHLLSPHAGQGLMIVQWANNETGVIQPIQAISTLCKKNGIKLHIDAVQSLGKIEISLKHLHFDSLAFSSHKLGGISGCAGLVINNQDINPLMHGGTQQQGIRPGTLPMHAILACALICEDWKQHQKEYIMHMKNARDSFEQTLLHILKDYQIAGIESPRLINTSQVLISGIRAQALLSSLDINGIAVSHGAACKTGSLSPSHVLLAMGYSPQEAKSAIRVSFGPNHTIRDGQIVAEKLIDCATRLRTVATQ